MRKNIVRIPKNVSLFYAEKNKIVIFKGPLGQRSLKLKTKIKLINNFNFIKITLTTFENVSKNKIKKLKSLQGTITALIKQAILEVSTPLCKKLNFVGVGYKAFLLKIFNNNILQFKLGFSHNIYFRVLNNLKISCLKYNKIFILGNFYLNVYQTVSLIRFFKKPEPYKGKGILYENEKIILKRGKKI